MIVVMLFTGCQIEISAITLVYIATYSFILNSLYYHVNIFIFIFYVSVFVVKN